MDNSAEYVIDSVILAGLIFISWWKKKNCDYLFDYCILYWSLQNH